MNATTITVTEQGGIYAFRVIPLTSLPEFFDNVALLQKQTDVSLGEKMGWWKVVS